jgi:predicted flap endonuclease-1-like 5' DNA nuclease
MMTEAVMTGARVQDGDGATARPDGEAVESALAAVAIASGFRTRLKLKAPADVERKAPEKSQIGACDDATENEAHPLIVPIVPDDLTRIRGISGEQAAALAAEGTATFAAISAWRPDDVKRMRRHLGLKREISKQNWIEQAALLVAQGPQSPRPIKPKWSMWDQPPAEPEAVPLLTAVAVHAPRLVQVAAPLEPSLPGRKRSSLDRLDLIRGLCPAAEGLLRAGGVTSASDIARWTSADMMAWSMRLGSGKRLSAAGWIEQAALLARGEPTHHARMSILLPEIETIEAPPDAGGQGVEAPLVVKLAAIRVAEAMRRTAEPLPVFDVAPAPMPIAAGVAATPPVAGELSRRLPRYIEFVRSPFFGLPPLPHTPLVHSRADAVEDLTRAAVTAGADAAPLVRAAAVEPTAPTKPGPDISPTKALTERIAKLENGAAAQPVQPSAPAPMDAVPRTDVPLDLARLERLGDDLPVLAATEADVVIVPSAEAVEAPVPSRPRFSAPSMRERRWQTTSAPPPADVQSYAAYRDRIEEASVEIVRATGSNKRPHPSRGLPAPADSGKLDRFLSALGVGPTDRSRP